MNYLIDRLQKYAQETPDRTALMLGDDREKLSFSELEDLSGRIYASLLKRGIGKEDMVMILLPRGIAIHVCMLGVLKAGAAFTVLEDTAPKERKALIAKDAACRLIIDRDLYAEMTEETAIPGCEDPDPHDACYAVYTSGSTGTPKGVLHEYGQITMYLKSAPPIRLSGRNDEVCVFISPLNFQAAISLFFSSVDAGACSLIADYRSVKDPAAFPKFLSEHKATHLLLTPSLLKSLSDVPSSVRQIFIGGEPAYAVDPKGKEVINAYASSESGFDVAVFPVDRSYPLTPVGKNRCGVKIFLLDDNGAETKRGEICFRNPYCRGYIGLPEQNRKAFVNGLFHTGDEGFFTENGDLVVCGRKDEMLKIRGNRVEPGEVETAIRRILSVDTAVVKGFKEGEREYLAAYVLRSGDPEKDCGEYLQKELAKRLPEYMVPSFFVFADRFPTLAGGKIDKKALAAPTIASTMKADPPADKTEEILCKMFARALSMENVGRKDDFFVLGGDSLTAMKMIAESPLRELTAADLWEARTPEKIAVRLRGRSVSAEERKALSFAAIQKAQPALLESQTTFEVQKYAPHSTMWNLSFLLEVKQGISPERLKEAVDRVLRHHPVFSSVFVSENGELKQKYVPERYEETRILSITEAEFAKLEKSLVKSFEEVTDALLYRKEIFVTEKRTLLFFDVHHAVTDGLSLKLLGEQVSAVCKDPKADLPEDHYYLILEDFAAERKSYEDPANEVTLRYRHLAEEYLRDENFLIPVFPDGTGTEMRRGVWEETPDFSKKDVRRFLKKHRLTENEFFSAALLLAIAKYNGKTRSMLQFVAGGRDDAMRAQSCGLFLHSIPLFADIGSLPVLSGFLEDIRAQAEYGAAHGNFNICTFVEQTFDLSVFFIFQKDLLHAPLPDFASRRIGLPAPNAADSLMEFCLIDNEGEENYRIETAYSATNYKEESVRRLHTYFTRIVNAILAETESAECCTVKIADLMQEKEHI